MNKHTYPGICLDRALSTKHRLKLEGYYQPQPNTMPSYARGDRVIVITVETKATECQLYTNVEKGGLFFLATDEELLKPWEFSIAKYDDAKGLSEAALRAAREYTRRKLTKLMGA